MESSHLLQQQLLSVVCISLHETDKLRVMNMSAEMVDSLRGVIQSSWTRGIKSEGSYAVSYEFKLGGRPWLGQGEEAVDARRLIARILGFMLQRGWVLVVATDVSRKEHTKDSLFFRSQPVPPQAAVTAAISFNMTDRVRVIDGTEELAQVVRSCIQNCWSRGLQGERIYNGVPEFKMHGRPWEPSGEGKMVTRMFVAQLIGALDGAGWEVYTSVDISYGTGGQSGENGRTPIRSMDSWVLRPKP